MSHHLVHLLESGDACTAVCSCSWTSAPVSSAWDAGRLWGSHHGRAVADEEPGSL